MNELTKESTIGLRHELGGITRINLLSYLIRHKPSLTQIRKYFATFGITIDEDLKDLEVII